jgi:hypothetical protein
MLSRCDYRRCAICRGKHEHLAASLGRLHGGVALIKTGRLYTVALTGKDAPGRPELPSHFDRLCTEDSAVPGSQRLRRRRGRAKDIHDNRDIRLAQVGTGESNVDHATAPARASTASVV